MSSDSSGRTRVVGFPRNEFALSRRNSPSDRDYFPDHVLRGRLENVARSRGSRQGNSGARNGDMYGWGREGRVRLEPLVFIREPGGSLNGYFGRGRQCEVNLNRENLYRLHDGDSEQDSQPIPSRLLDLPYGLAVCPPESPPYQPDILLEDGGHSLDPYIRGALEFHDIGEGSHIESLGSVSEYSLGHLDRGGTTYHYQPPYVEDYISELEEELQRQQDELDSLPDMMSESEFSGLLSPRGGYFVDPGEDGREMPYL